LGTSSSCAAAAMTGISGSCTQRYDLDEHEVVCVMKGDGSSVRSLLTLTRVSTGAKAGYRGWWSTSFARKKLCRVYRVRALAQPPARPLASLRAQCARRCCTHRSGTCYCYVQTCSN
jgi:hypothetical protein